MNDVPQDQPGAAPGAGPGNGAGTDPTAAPTRTGLVVVASTRAAEGVYADRTGPILVDWLRGHGITVPDPAVVADRDIESFFAELLSVPRKPAEVIISTGGTGIGPADRTIEAIEPHLDQKLPGLVQAFFARGLEHTPKAVLSRAVAGIAGRTFIMALPGSKGAVTDGIATLEPVLDHILNVLEDRNVH